MQNPFEPINARLTNLEVLMLEALQCLRAAQPEAAKIGGIELAQEITRLSKARIYALVSERGIPHAKRGNRLTFNRTELLAWVAEGNRQQQKSR
jgi:excisionase family DNA binding protein